MKNIITIALNDLRVFFADTGNLVGLLGLPIVLTIVLGFATQGDSRAVSLRVDLLDQDNSPTSQALIADLKAANNALYFCPQDNATQDCALPSSDPTLTLEQAQKRVKDGVSYSLLVIPNGFESAILQLENVDITYYSRATLQTGDVVLGALQSVIAKRNVAVVSAITAVQVGENFYTGNIFTDDSDEQAFSTRAIATANTLLKAEPLAVTLTLDDRTSISATQGFGQSVPGIGSMSVMFTVFGGLFVLIRERKQWTLQRLVMLPVTKGEIIGGKILTYFTIGMLQYGVVFLVGIVMGTSFGNDPLALVLTMTSFVLCITAITFALATWLETEPQANGLSLLLTMTLAPLGGAWWPLEIVPSFMRVIGMASPVSWAMDSYRKLTFYNATLGDIWSNLAILLVIAGVFFYIGVRHFKYE